MNAPRAAVYCRISRDAEGLRVGVERQEQDCRKLAVERGYNVVRVFIDNDTGASTLSRKPRPQFEAMLDMAERNRIETILAYSDSRLTRRPSEWEDLIALAGQYGVRIETVVNGAKDLSHAGGRFQARMQGNVDAHEAEVIGERVARALLQRAQDGKPAHGGRQFGWMPDKHTLHPQESTLIRQAAADVLAGVPLRRIAAQWNEAGVRTSRGGAWTHTTVRRMLKRPTLAGWRMHHGEVALDSAGQRVKGKWTPILDQDTFDRVQVALARDTEGGVRRGGRRYLLTGLARCAVCGARMNGTKTKASYAYTCGQEPSDHSVTIVGPQTDDLVLRVARERLAAEELSAPQQSFSGDARLAEIATRVEELGKELDNAGAATGFIIGQVKKLETEADGLRRERRKWIAETATQASAEVSADALDGLDQDRQRAVLETLFQAVIIKPATRRGEPWTPDRVSYAWRS